MYLYLAIFWFVFGVTLQIFWTRFNEFAQIPVDRTIVGVFCFVLVSYNFFRWRIGRAMQKAKEKLDEPPPNARRDNQEYNPAFDFSKPDEPNKNESK